jgi:protein-tyrosine-phosphatase/predicted ATP-grasp superfamily ATP-dependent carboligase
MTAPAVLVTDAHELAALGAIRSLGRAGYRVIAAAPPGAQPASRWSRHVDRFESHPNAWRHQSAFADWLLEAVKRHEPAFVLPISEAAIVAAAAHRERIEQTSVVLAPASNALKYSLSKYWASKAAVLAGLLIPQTLFVASGSGDWQTEGLDELEFPVVVKTDNVLLNAEAYDKGRTRTVHCKEDLQLLLDEAREQGRSVIVQQRVPGFGAGAFLLRLDGETLLEFAHERVHEVPYSGGWSAVRRAADDPAAIAAGKRLLQAIDYDGVAMVEFRKTQNGDLLFMEINGRLWGSLALALHARRDFPAVWVRRRDRRLVSPPAAPTSKPRAVYCSNRYPGEFGFLLSVLRARGGGTDAAARPSLSRALREVVKYSIDPRVKHDHFWWTDPLPGLRQGAKFVADMAAAARTRLAREVRGRQKARWLTDLKRAATREPAPAGAQSKLLFLCYGNICRSPVAAAAAKRELPSAQIDSAGFHPEVHRESPANVIVAARRIGLNMEGHRSQRVTGEMVAAADHILVMDLANYADFRRAFPDSAHKVLLLGTFASADSPEIRDPYGWSAAETLPVMQQIETAVRSLRQWLQAGSQRRESNTFTAER